MFNTDFEAILSAKALRSEESNAASFLLLQKNRSLSKVSRVNAFATPNGLEMLTFTCSKIEPTSLSMLS